MLTDHDGTADPTQSRALRVSHCSNIMGNANRYFHQSLSSKNISQFIALTLLTIPVVAVVLLVSALKITAIIKLTMKQHYDHLLTADREVIALECTVMNND